MPEDRMVFYGELAKFLSDSTRLLDLEGAFRSAKTTTALRKVAGSCRDHPGIQWWINRYSDGDTQRQLKPQWRQMLDRMGMTPTWDPTEQADRLPNGSKVYIFGVKAQDQLARYSKIRGLTLAGIYNDQSEELPHDVFMEFIGRLSQPGFPHQLILTPNPPEEDHWLTKEFPEDNSRPDRKYYSVPIHANARNLPAGTIENLIAVYPPEHPKHRSAVLGLRGMNVQGEPVYGGAFRRELHEQRLTFNPDLLLELSIDFGKRHPCAVYRQQSPYGQRLYLGGVLGMDLFLDDFIPILQRYEQEWFPNQKAGRVVCCDPAGSHASNQGMRKNGVQLLREYGFPVQWKDNSNAPDVRLACVEAMGAAMRKRTPQGEALIVNTENWLRVSAKQVVPYRFLAAAFEAGYVWDTHFVSVGSKQLRKPKKDGWYEHGMNCLHGDTRVVTDEGSVPIRELIGPVRVLSRAGAWAWGTARQTGTARPMVRLTFGDGAEVVCTPDHRFLTPSGWVRAAQMGGQRCYNGVWQAQMIARATSSLKARSIGVLGRTISDWVSGCIGLFGSGPMGRCQPVMISTIGTMTRMTTRSRIWNVSSGSIISAITGSRGKVSVRRDTLLSRAARGIGPLTAWHGIAGIMSSTRSRYGANAIGETAPGAGRRSRVRDLRQASRACSVLPTAAQKIARRVVWMLRNGAAWCVASLFGWIAMWRLGHVAGLVKTSSLVSCVSVEATASADSYCLDVPGTRAFCVESGLVTHNCAEYLELNFTGLKPKKRDEWKPHAIQPSPVGWMQ